jgi:ubiquinone biosynthesis protein
MGMVDEYFKTLELETNFIVEANNMSRFKNNFKSETNVVIPEVHFDLTTERVLTMEALQGKPVSQFENVAANSGSLNSNPDKIIELGLRIYLKMVFADGFFHGDLHPGNFFILPNNKIGLIDFGVVGRLNFKTQSAIVNMLVALSKEDYLRLAYEYVDLTPYSDKVNVDLFAKELQAIIAPYYGLTLKNVNVGKILLSSSSVAARHGLSVPTELMLFFKSIISIESLGQKISKDFDFLTYTLTQVNEVAENFFQPIKVANEASLIFRESRNFLSALPRQLNLMMRKVNSPDYHSKVHLEDFSEFKNTFLKSFTLLFLGIVIAALVISSTMLYDVSASWMVAGIPGISFTGYILAAFLGLYAAYKLFKD